MAAIPQDEVGYLLLLLDGAQQARFLALAASVVLLYDYFLTLEKEITYFWTGAWSATRVLFLFNRYFSPVVAILTVTFLYAPNLSPETCSRAIPATFILGYIGIAVIQAIIVFRIWYIYSQRRIARLVIVGLFLATFIITTAFMAVVYHDLHQVYAPIPGLQIRGCSVPPSQQMWKVFLPNLILHTIMYTATTWPAVRLHQMGGHSPLMNRLVQDGGIFYASVFIATLFCTVGSLERNHPRVMVPAIYSNFILSISSVSLSRLMLNIHSLAASLCMDTEMLLSAAELSRVQWKRGARKGELIVEVDAVEEDDNMQHGRMPQGIHSTRVGVYDDMRMPGADRMSKHVKLEKLPPVRFSADFPYELSWVSD